MAASRKKPVASHEPDDSDDVSQMDFETVMEELETIVKKLEGEGLSLEESIGLFERGMRLATDGMKKLDAAEKKVEILLHEAEEETTVPFEPGQGS